MEKLAKRRQKIHKTLIQQLRKKIIKIREDAIEHDQDLEKIDYEMQLIMMDQF